MRQAAQEAGLVLAHAAACVSTGCNWRLNLRWGQIGKDQRFSPPQRWHLGVRQPTTALPAHVPSRKWS